METILQLVWACLGPSGALHTPFDNMILHALQRCTMRQPEATRRCFRHRTAFPQHSLLLQAHKSCSTRADIHTKAARRATAATETAVGQNGAPPAAVPAAAPGSSTAATTAAAPGAASPQLTATLLVQCPDQPGVVAALEAELEELLVEHDVDLVVLARYMQVLSPGFCKRHRDVINIHHSFLPAFEGAKPYHRAHERGVKIIGATSHYVTSDLDAGPIIEQDVVRTSHRDSVQDLVRKGRDLERQCLARALRWHLQDRILVDHGANKTVVFE